MPVLRAARFARALACLGASAQAIGCTSGGAPPTNGSPSLDGGVDASLADGSTTPLDAAMDSTIARSDSDADLLLPFDVAGLDVADAMGTCHTAENDATPCPPGGICATDDAGSPLCIDAARAKDDVTPCGVVGCAFARDCYCAQTTTSFCECDYAVGPLPPPDLPAAVGSGE